VSVVVCFIHIIIMMILTRVTGSFGLVTNGTSITGTVAVCIQAPAQDPPVPALSYCWLQLCQCQCQCQSKIFNVARIQEYENYYEVHERAVESQNYSCMLGKDWRKRNVLRRWRQRWGWLDVRWQWDQSAFVLCTVVRRRAAVTVQRVRCRLQIRHDTRCYFIVRSKADVISQLNLPRGNDN